MGIKTLKRNWEISKIYKIGSPSTAKNGVFDDKKRLAKTSLFYFV